MKWTDKKVQALRELCEKGTPNKDIATILQCNVSDIYAKRGQLGITIPKIKVAKEADTEKPAFYESVKESLKDLQSTLWSALNSPKITVEEDRILSELVTLIQGAEGLFLQAIKED